MDAAGPDSGVSALAATLLDSNTQSFHNHMKDLGEALTVAHARNYKGMGTPVHVLIDDGRGQGFAGRYRIIGEHRVAQTIAQVVISLRSVATEVYFQGWRSPSKSP